MRLPIPSMHGVTTERLLFRTTKLEDCTWWMEYMNDATAIRFMPFTLGSEEDCRFFIQRTLDRYATDGSGLNAVIERSTGKPVGMIGLLTQVVDGVDELEIGYHIEQGVISSYSIVDLETQRDTVLARIKGLPAQPDGIFFLPNSDGFTVEDGITHFDSVCRDIVNKTGSSIKVIISTEAQAHEAYLDYCISNGFDSLTTKPILLPMKEGLFDPISMNERMQSLVSKAKERPANHAVLCLGRYHEVYNEGVEAQILEKMSALQVPITSIEPPPINESGSRVIWWAVRG